MGEPLKHPEGLPFPPSGLGWTTDEITIPHSGDKVTLLTDHNVAAVKRNRPIEWDKEMDALVSVAPPPVRDKRTGAMVPGMSEQERERLVALSILVSRGVLGKEYVHDDSVGTNA